VKSFASYPVFNHPALILAVMAVVSGILGTYVDGPVYGDPPHPGVYMVLTGAWFGLVVGFGVWQWGNRTPIAVATAFVATWVGWQAAVNVALQFEEPWLAAALPDGLRMSVSGVAAGAVGAFATWFGAALSTARLRHSIVAVGVPAIGGLFGLLLPLTSHYDNAIALLVPWQAAIAATLGLALAPERVGRPFGSMSGR
jgi:hypothetical protein